MPIDGSPATAVCVVGRPLDLLAWRLDRGNVEAVVETGDRVGMLHITAATLRAGLRSRTAADLRLAARLPPKSDARMRVITQNGPRLREYGTIAAGEWREYAFTYAGRIYVLHDEGLVEHELRGEVVTERRRIGLASTRRPGR